MKAGQLKKKYLEFFKSKGHAVIPPAPLIPEHDPTVLFTTAGMHPLVPYFIGQKHPLGKRATNVQKCLRTGDIDEIGDAVHHTFFEMLGNWSFGDYFKKEAIEFSFEFLTKVLKLPVSHLAVSCFQGDKDAPKDTESARVWESLGIPKERIAFLGREDNWWGPAGDTGPCGPCTEMYYWAAKEKPSKIFDVKDKRWVEIGNDVIMEYDKKIRTILVDGMHTIYDQNFKVNSPLLEIVNSFRARKILVVNGFREKGKQLLEKDGFAAFSMEEEGITKENPRFFKALLEKYGLKPEEVLYFDHKKENSGTARKLGIISKQYINEKETKKFIQENINYFLPLKQKNIDFGGGVERTLAVLNGLDDNYLTDLFLPIIKAIEKMTGLKYGDKPDSEYIKEGKQCWVDIRKQFRIIADHIKASVFILGDERGVTPSNLDQGYILRRFIRRVIRTLKKLGIKIEEIDLTLLAREVIKIYQEDYPSLKEKESFIMEELKKEQDKFTGTLEKGLNKFSRLAEETKTGGGGAISGPDAFLLFQSFGFPLEMTEELAVEKGIKVDSAGFQKEFEKHQQLSRVGAEQKFKGGLSDASEETAKLHTATHLLNEALRRLVSQDIAQKGSNITPERLRFDFNFWRKLTSEELKKVEDEVNRVIKLGLAVKREELPLKEAFARGAHGEFGAKYPEKVSVYFIGDYSKEICGGPHVGNTQELGRLKIIKEESSSAGVRRIKAVLEKK